MFGCSKYLHVLLSQREIAMKPSYGGIIKTIITQLGEKQRNINGVEGAREVQQHQRRNQPPILSSQKVINHIRKSSSRPKTLAESRLTAREQFLFLKEPKSHMGGAPNTLTRSSGVRNWKTCAPSLLRTKTRPRLVQQYFHWRARHSSRARWNSWRLGRVRRSFTNTRPLPSGTPRRVRAARSSSSRSWRRASRTTTRRARAPSAGGAPTRSANTTSRSSSGTPRRAASTATLCRTFSPFCSESWPISRSASRASWSRSFSSSLSPATVRSSSATDAAPPPAGPGRSAASSRRSIASRRAALASSPWFALSSSAFIRSSRPTTSLIMLRTASFSETRAGWTPPVAGSTLSSMLCSSAVWVSSSRDIPVSSRLSVRAAAAARRVVTWLTSEDLTGVSVLSPPFRWLQTHSGHIHLLLCSDVIVL
ncbi:serine/arginine repetitive matrix protein 2-like [Ostrinia nubilalis]|uniref:serine/arginine repetitive matrix protein 2-like n=1 Tax=Ostrinia nubilalis TaxID=29057 RepID=UPI0030823AA6